MDFTTSKEAGTAFVFAPPPSTAHISTRIALGPKNCKQISVIISVCLYFRYVVVIQLDGLGPFNYLLNLQQSSRSVSPCVENCFVNIRWAIWASKKLLMPCEVHLGLDNGTKTSPWIKISFFVESKPNGKHPFSAAPLPCMCVKFKFPPYPQTKQTMIDCHPRDILYTSDK